MRRRAADFRRPLRARRFPNAFWWVLCGAAVLLFIYTLSRGNQIESRPLITPRYRHDRVMEGLNITEEMLSPNSVTRQISDQIALAKAFVVIAKESNNLQFAWELSAQIRNSQILLSNAATRRSPLTVGESETAIHDMAIVLYQAQQLHYDSATMIMRLKAKIQSLEEQMSSVSEKSSKYGQIAAEEVPKSLYCLGIQLTSEWFRHPNPQRKLKDRKIRRECLGFSVNSFRGVTVEVQKFEDFKMAECFLCSCP
ncbi:hypothetical protein M0R45_033039 [Rubus argutus]|uniref:Uncharacterized protein n=1 Tax=Rubus argutus TaxID=59490 RepID=A0AAW1WL27_RUBAR